jgi:uncharacterized protein YndB with AHSA1/START domain
MSKTTTLRVERDIPGPIEEVFDAWLDPRSLSQWMTPVQGGVAEAHVRPVVGGSFRIVMKSGETEIPHEGEYRVIERPHKLVFTWNSPYSNDTLVTVGFARLSSLVTRITLTHERFSDRAAMESHRGGWESILSALESYALKQRGD